MGTGKLHGYPPSPRAAPPPPLWCCAVNFEIQKVAWLFNIRGSDISFNPVPLAAALLTQDEVFLFIDESKLGDDVKQV